MLLPGVPCPYPDAMIRSELVLRLAALNPQLYEKDCVALVNAILGRISDALAAGDRVEIRGFGSFAAKEQPARQGHNSKNGGPDRGAGQDRADLQGQQGDVGSARVIGSTLRTVEDRFIISRIARIGSGQRFPELTQGAISGRSFLCTQLRAFANIRLRRRLTR